MQTFKQFLENDKGELSGERMSVIANHMNKLFKSRPGQWMQRYGNSSYTLSAIIADSELAPEGMLEKALVNVAKKAGLAFKSHSTSTFKDPGKGDTWLHVRFEL